jgi:hypothetical protein
MDPTADMVSYSASEVFTAIVHGYYYIKPGRNALKFIDKITKILDRGCKEYDKRHPDMKNGVSFDVWLWGKVLSDSLCIAREMFDEEYYMSQVSNVCLDEKYEDVVSHTDIDPSMLAYMIKAFKYSPPIIATEYIGLAIRLKDEHEVSIFNPKVTDLKRLNLKPDTLESLEVLHQSKAGKIMVAPNANN